MKKLTLTMIALIISGSASAYTHYRVIDGKSLYENKQPEEKVVVNYTEVNFFDKTNESDKGVASKECVIGKHGEGSKKHKLAIRFTAKQEIEASGIPKFDYELYTGVDGGRFENKDGEIEYKGYEKQGKITAYYDDSFSKSLPVGVKGFTTYWADRENVEWLIDALTDKELTVYQGMNTRELPAFSSIMDREAIKAFKRCVSVVKSGQ